MLAILGWFVLIAICVFFTLVGAAMLFVGSLFGEGSTKVVGTIVLACALTGLYNTAHVAPFTVSLDTHVYQEHK